MSRAGTLAPPKLEFPNIERRLLRACKTLRALPDPERKYQQIHNCWPDTVRSVEDAYGYTDISFPRFKPSPADVSDMLIALAWVRGLEHDEFKLIWWRSFDVSYRHMGNKLHRSDEFARYKYRDAMLKVWHAANRSA